MSIQSLLQLKNTKEKLRQLEEHYEQTKQAPAENARIRELSLISLKRFINQLTEEIVRYEAHHKVSS